MSTEEIWQNQIKSEDCFRTWRSAPRRWWITVKMQKGQGSFAAGETTPGIISECSAEKESEKIIHQSL
jgi:hypothetical protein